MSVRRTSCMGTQHAQRVVVKRNTCTEDLCNNTHRVGTSNQWPVQHNSSYRMHVHVTMYVSVCTMHHYQTGLLYATYMYNHLVCASVLCT